MTPTPIPSAVSRVGELSNERDRLIHILVVHFDMFRAKAEEAADLFLHDRTLSRRSLETAGGVDEADVSRAYEAAAAVLRGTSADIAVGELDRMVRAVIAALASRPSRSTQQGGVGMASSSESHGTHDLSVDRNVMGTAQDAREKLAALAAEYRLCRQPYMATAKEHKQREAMERETRLRLADAALLWLWHEENPEPHP